MDGAPDASRAEIGVEVDAFEIWIGLPAVTVAAGYRTTEIVVVLEDRKSRATIQEIITASRWVIVVAVRGFEHVPAVIFSSAARRWLEVDLFPGVLTHVRDKKVPGGSIEGTTPGVAQAVGPDLIQPGNAHKRIIWWHCVIAVRITREIIAIDVYPQDLTQPCFEILSVSERIAATTSVAYGNIKVPIRTECELSAVVVANGLSLSQDYLRRVWISHIRVGGGNLIAGNDCGAVVGSGVIDVEESI